MNLHPHKRTLSALSMEALAKAESFHQLVSNHLAYLEDNQDSLDSDQLSQAYNLEAITEQIKHTISRVTDYLADELKEVADE